MDFFTHVCCKYNVNSNNTKTHNNTIKLWLILLVESIPTAAVWPFIMLLKYNMVSLPAELPNEKLRKGRQRAKFRNWVFAELTRGDQ